MVMDQGMTTATEYMMNSCYEALSIACKNRNYNEVRRCYGLLSKYVVESTVVDIEINPKDFISRPEPIQLPMELSTEKSGQSGTVCLVEAGGDYQKPASYTAVMSVVADENLIPKYCESMGYAPSSYGDNSFYYFSVRGFSLWLRSADNINPLLTQNPKLEKRISTGFYRCTRYREQCLREGLWVSRHLAYDYGIRGRYFYFLEPCDYSSFGMRPEVGA